MNERLHLTVSGRVQGVYYRAFAQAEARRRGLVGWVRNLPGGGVELLAEGPRMTLEGLLTWAWEGPPAARVERVEAVWAAATGEFEDFTIWR
ncbi:MAG: acylphosphatase [Myxococcota bacterium]